MLKKLVLALSLVFAGFAAAPVAANAMPVAAPPAIAAGLPSGIETVQYRRPHYRYHRRVYHRRWHPVRRYHRPYYARRHYGWHRGHAYGHRRHWR